MAGTTSRHSLWVKVMGAAKAAAKNKLVAKSIQHITTASRQLRAGLLGMRGMMTGAAASLVAMGLALRRVVSDYERYTLAQSRLRTALAANTEHGARNARLFAGPLAEAVGRDFGYSLAESNEAMATMIQTGIGVHKSMRVFRSSMRLARISDMDTAHATRFLVDTMNMFKDEVREGEGTVQAFADRMSGQLAVSAYSTSTSITDLQQAFRYAGTELSSMGYNSREVMSALAGLSVVGLRSTTAGTRLRGAMMAMQNPTSRLSRELRQHGIGVDEITGAWWNADGSLRRFYDGMTNMTAIMQRLPSQQARVAISTRLFGRRAYAGGQVVTGMSEATNRARRAFIEMGEEGENVGVVLERMERERMRSFSMQMTQLREGVSDLAIGFGRILFGEMKEGERGFGTYMRQLSEGVLLIGELNNGNAVSRERWNALPPDIREAATELRSTFIDIAAGLKVLGRILVWMAAFTRDHPYLVGSIIAIKLAFGGLIPALTLAGKGLLYIMAGGTAATAGLVALLAVVFALTVAVVNKAIPSIRDYGEELFGTEGSIDRVREATGNTTSAWLEQIPVIGNIAAIYVDIAYAMKTVFDVIRGNRSLWSILRLAQGEGPTAEQQVRSRIGQRASKLGRAGASYGSEEELHSIAAERERSSSERSLATHLYASAITGLSQIAGRLESIGFSKAESAITARRLARIQLDEQTKTRGTRLRGDERIGGPSLRDRTTQVGNEFRQLTIQAARAAATLQDVGEADVLGESGGSQPQSIMPPAQDAYVNRGGLLNVSGGDLIVSRRHLADAVTARRGALAGPAVGAAASGSMAGPAPSSGTGGGDVVVPMSVQIDGREIARAVGRASIQQLERGGGNIAPGERRSLRETGFRRNV